MHGFIATVSDFFGAIGADNLGAFALFVGLSVAAVINGLRNASKVRQPYAEPLNKRLDRIELEHDQLEERQTLSDARLARIEGQVGVLQTILLSKGE